MLSSLEIRIGSARSAPNLTASHMLAVSPKTLWSSREMWIMERENRSRNWIWMTTTVVNKNLIHLLAHIQWMWNIMLRINRDDDDCRDFELQLYYSLLNVQPRPSSSDSTKKKIHKFYYSNYYSVLLPSSCSRYFPTLCWATKHFSTKWREKKITPHMTALVYSIFIIVGYMSDLDI